MPVSILAQTGPGFGDNGLSFGPFDDPWDILIGASVPNALQYQVAKKGLSGSAKWDTGNIGLLLGGQSYKLVNCYGVRFAEYGGNSTTGLITALANDDPDIQFPNLGDIAFTNSGTTNSQVPTLNYQEQVLANDVPMTNANTLYPIFQFDLPNTSSGTWLLLAYLTVLTATAGGVTGTLEQFNQKASQYMSLAESESYAQSTLAAEVVMMGIVKVFSIASSEIQVQAACTTAGATAKALTPRNSNGGAACRVECIQIG